MREKKKMLGEDDIEADPKGEVTDLGLEKEPEMEGEAFQVPFCHLGWELIF